MSAGEVLQVGFLCKTFESVIAHELFLPVKGIIKAGIEQSKTERDIFFTISEKMVRFIFIPANWFKQKHFN